MESFLSVGSNMSVRSGTVLQFKACDKILYFADRASRYNFL